MKSSRTSLVLNLNFYSGATQNLKILTTTNFCSSASDKLANISSDDNASTVIAVVMVPVLFSYFRMLALRYETNNKPRQRREMKEQISSFAQKQNVV